MNISTESKRLTTEEFLEATRIALELVKLYKAGVLTGGDDSRAETMARALTVFSASFAGFDDDEPEHPGKYDAPEPMPKEANPTGSEPAQSVLAWL